MDVAIRELDIGELDLVAGGYAVTNWREVAGEVIKGLFAAGGTEAGAAIGTAIAPGVGTIAGGIIGGLISLAAGTIVGGSL